MKFLEPLKVEEQQALVIKAKMDPEAREKVILHNLKLVYSVAKRYVNKKTDIEDLF
ncbi:hypothetical protein [Anaeromicrobium sediminis]|uniref:hypothetical protein n=1 Tax=Anaeromicrobium sediminis TaxID=1478221 RepID=UPI001595AEAD|nr:hypothetical protein [Anaeromicrobium sediminis]